MKGYIYLRIRQISQTGAGAKIKPKVLGNPYSIHKLRIV